MSGIDALRVLVTRPLSQGQRTAKKLRAMGYTPILAPMLRIDPVVPPSLPDFGEAQAVLVTSVNGLERLAALTPERSTPILTVGDRTASVAQRAGFMNIRSASGDGHALMDLARAHLTPDAGPVIHIRGRHAAVEFDGLTDLGFQFGEIIAYEAVETAVLPKAALSPPFASVILVYSARSGSALSEALRNVSFDLMRLTIIGLSAAALQPLTATGACLVEAKTPDETALLVALAEIVPPAIKN